MLTIDWAIRARIIDVRIRAATGRSGARGRTARGPRDAGLSASTGGPVGRPPGPTVTTESGPGSPSAGRATSWRTVGRSATSACRRAGSNAASVSTRVPRAPHGPGDRREVDRPEIGRDLDLAALPAPPLLVHPDRAVALVVEDDRDDPGLLADRGLELGHRHREAAVAGERDDRPVAMDERGRDRRRQRRSPSRPRSGRGTCRAGGTGSGGRATAAKLPASVATIASSGRSRRSVAIAWPGWTPGPSQAAVVDRGRRLPGRSIRRVDGLAGRRHEPRRRATASGARVDRGPQERPRVGADRQRSAAGRPARAASGSMSTCAQRWPPRGHRVAVATSISSSRLPMTSSASAASSRSRTARRPP